MSIDIERLEANLRLARTLELERAAQRAAVAAVLRSSTSGPEILLIRRTEQPNDPWSGHMAFPGGRHERFDADLETTARRETHEEVGLDLARAGTLVGRLDDVRAVGRGRPLDMVISPFVYRLSREEPDLRPRASEVDEIHWAPLGPLARGERDTEVEYDWRGEKVKLPGLKVGERVVWGLTYQMLQILFRHLR